MAGANPGVPARLSAGRTVFRALLLSFARLWGRRVRLADTTARTTIATIAVPGPEDPATEAVLQSQGQLGQQVRHLTSEIEQLREQQNQGGSPYVMRPPNAPESEQPQNAVPVTLILRGGRTLKVKDYAVMNGVLWDFTVQPARKIAVSEVDVEASAKATQAAGGEFPDLSASAQQEN